MDASLANLTFRYRLEFAQPMVEIAVQSGRVLEEIVAQLSTKFTVVASDLRVRSGPTVADHGVRVTLFNGLGTIDLTVENIECAFKNLTSAADLEIAVDVVELSVRALGSVLPKLAKSAEVVIADLVYTVVGGEFDRDKFFAHSTFLGKGSSHKDVGFKFRSLASSLGDIPIGFDVSPVWLDPAALYIHVNAPLGITTSESIRVRAKKLVEFIESVISSLGITLVPVQLTRGVGT